MQLAARHWAGAAIRGLSRRSAHPPLRRRNRTPPRYVQAAHPARDGSRRCPPRSSHRGRPRATIAFRRPARRSRCPRWRSRPTRREDRGQRRRSGSSGAPTGAPARPNPSPRHHRWPHLGDSAQSHRVATDQLHPCPRGEYGRVSGRSGPSSAVGRVAPRRRTLRQVENHPPEVVTRLVIDVPESHVRALHGILVVHAQRNAREASRLTAERAKVAEDVDAPQPTADQSDLHGPPMIDASPRAQRERAAVPAPVTGSGSSARVAATDVSRHHATAMTNSYTLYPTTKSPSMNVCLVQRNL